MYRTLRRLGASLSLFAAAIVIHATESVDPLRLTSEVVPVAQSVELALDPAKDNYTGHTVINLLANVPFTSFRLHAEGPAFTTATLTSAEGEVTALTAVVTDAKHNLVTLTVPASLKGDRGAYPGKTPTD